MGKKFPSQIAKKVDVSNEDVVNVMNYVVKSIQQLGGVYTASIPTIIENMGEDKTDAGMYSKYMSILDMASKAYDLKWHHAGRLGRRYYMDSADLAGYLALEKTLPGLATVSHITLFCPCCHTPTNYELSIKPVR